jgi:drug/metabolite transporter (DMT)-like permease
MNSIVLALAASVCFGAGLVLTQLGLKHLPPLNGAAISIPSSLVLLICVAPLALASDAVHWNAVPIFAAVGLLYPGAATLLTFAANRALGPVITGALGNLAPLFAVALAFVMLGEPLRPAQVAGLLVIVMGVAMLTVGRGGPTGGNWRSWFLLLPLLAAAIRGLIQPLIKLGLELWPSPFAASLISYAVSSAIVIAAAKLATGRWIADASPRDHLWFIGVGVCNGLAVLLMYAALAQASVALVSPLVATYPLVTVLGSALLLGRSEGGLRLALAVAISVAGVVLLLAG